MSVKSKIIKLKNTYDDYINNERRAMQFFVDIQNDYYITGADPHCRVGFIYLKDKNTHEEIAIWPDDIKSNTDAKFDHSITTEVFKLFAMYFHASRRNELMIK